MSYWWVGPPAPLELNGVGEEEGGRGKRGCKLVSPLCLQVDQITRQIAYPDFVLDKEKLDQFYDLVSLIVVM